MPDQAAYLVVERQKEMTRKKSRVKKLGPIHYIVRYGKVSAEDNFNVVHLKRYGLLPSMA